MPKILVTGANGFVGRGLCRALRAAGTDTVAAVRTGRGPDQVAIGDLIATPDWSGALAGVGVVVHLAARVHVMNDTAHDRLAAFRAVNVDATLHLARQAAQAGVRRFIFISSIGVNGAATAGTPFSELSAPQPHSEYAVAKFEAEEGLQKLRAEVGMEFVIIRPPLVYGPDAPGNFHSLLKLVQQSADAIGGGAQPALDGFPGQSGGFYYPVHPCAGRGKQLFLIADETDVSTSDLIRLLSEGMGRRARLWRVPVALLAAGARLAGKQNMFQQLCGSLQLDTSKARNLLGWVPPVDTREGLRLAGRGYLKGYE